MLFAAQLAHQFLRNFSDFDRLFDEEENQQRGTEQLWKLEEHQGKGKGKEQLCESGVNQQEDEMKQEQREEAQEQEKGWD
mmetsp:Transcript_42273/g.68561  ORF Transcript_42273/g.68561 Transcript_42273/m.68561 type:complete len:80 (+) Transcript_42273:631-870(+)